MFRFLTNLFADESASRPTARTVLGGQGIALDAREVPATLTPKQLAGLQAAIQSLAQPVTADTQPPAPTAPSAPATSAPAPAPSAEAPTPNQQTPAPAPSGGTSAPPAGGVSPQPNTAPSAQPTPTASPQPKPGLLTQEEAAYQEKLRFEEEMKQKQLEQLQQQRKQEQERMALKLAQQLLPTLQSVIAKFAVPLTPVTKG